jgi:hypothetical protein
MSSMMFLFVKQNKKRMRALVVIGVKSKKHMFCYCFYFYTRNINDVGMFEKRILQIHFWLNTYIPKRCGCAAAVYCLRLRMYTITINKKKEKNEMNAKHRGIQYCILYNAWFAHRTHHTCIT